jgi:hypothetical protein
VAKIAPISLRRHERLFANLDKGQVYEILEKLQLAAEDLLRHPDE